MIKKVKSEPTNQDLASLIKKNTEFMLQQFEKVDDRFNEMQQQMVEFKDGVYNKMDAVYKEVLAFRDEEVMHKAGQVRLQDSVDDHEKRIRKLEKPHITPHRIRR